MNHQEILRDLELANDLVASVKVRIAISRLLNPNVVELEEMLSDSIARIVRVQEQMRKSKRQELRRI